MFDPTVRIAFLDDDLEVAEARRRIIDEWFADNIDKAPVRVSTATFKFVEDFFDAVEEVGPFDVIVSDMYMRPRSAPDEDESPEGGGLAVRDWLKTMRSESPEEFTHVQLLLISDKSTVSRLILDIATLRADLGWCGFTEHRAMESSFILRVCQLAERACPRAFRPHAVPDEGVLAPSMQRLMLRVRSLAPYADTVLITGDTGAGKEYVAKIIHKLSPRKDRKWVPVNVAAITPTLIESELFGHVRGAFSGANSAHTGKLEFVQGGTLFLDEIGELPLESQAKLLRAIQERKVAPVGSTQERSVSFALICATNRDLRTMMEDGHFREDLYYRIAVHCLEVPPLGERREEIPYLADALLSEVANRLGERRPLVISQDLLDRLASSRWRGNVRELRNEIERCLISALARASLTLEVRDLSEQYWESQSARGNQGVRAETLAALDEADWKVYRAAAILGLSAKAVYDRIFDERNGLERDAERHGIRRRPRR